MKSGKNDALEINYLMVTGTSKSNKPENNTPSKYYQNSLLSQILINQTNGVSGMRNKNIIKHRMRPA